jgi:hypothetical protein
MINKVKSKIKNLLSINENDQRIVLFNPGEKEPDLRVVGLFSDVVDEKVSEIVTGLIYMNEVNKASKEKR